MTWIFGMPGTSSEVDAILIFGGDGTVHRYLAQLVELSLPVLVVPCGSGNDFARALGLRDVRSSLAAWRKFSSGTSNVWSIDLGVISPLTGDQPEAGESSTPHCFCCVGGVGLDGEVARRANQLPRWLRGHGGYILSFISALFRFLPVTVKISVPHAEEALIAQNSKSVVLAAFANAPAYGGGMKIAPGAQLDDGALEICVIHPMNKLKLCCLFPTVYFGRHLSVPQVESFRTERLRVETEEPIDVYADGEYICRTPIEVSVARGALRVIRG